MALDPKITSIKAAGTYRFEFDKSQVVSIPAEQTRLVIGFSKRGPVNTPVFVPDTAFFKQVYGDIDRNLEKKDSFFHRSCLTALERGPILALNLLRLDDNVDEIEYIKMATACTFYGAQDNGPDPEAPYSGFFNQDKFWYPDTDAFLNNVGADQSQYTSSTTNDLLDFTNLGKTPVSIIVRKAAAANVAGFNVTVKEWYGAANVPDYLDGDSLISDFFVDVFIIDGNWGGDFANVTPYERFDADPTFQTYFNKTKGIQRKVLPTDATDTKLQEFFNEDEVDLIAQYTSCLLPNFVDLLGNNLFVENMINADTATTGLYCAVNEKLFDEILLDGVPGGIDLVGHNLEWVTTNQDDCCVNFLSYEDTIVSNLEFCRDGAEITNVDLSTGESISITEFTGGGDIQIQIIGPGDAFDAFASMTANVAGSVVGTYILENAGGLGAAAQYVPVTAVNVVSATSVVTVTLSGVGTVIANWDDTLSFDFVNPSGQFVQMWDGGAASAFMIASQGSDTFTYYSNGSLTDGDEVRFGPTLLDPATTDSYLTFATINYSFIHDGDGETIAGNIHTISDPDYNLASVLISPYQDSVYTSPSPIAEFNLDSLTDFFWGAGAGAAGALHCLVVQTLKGSMNQSIAVIGDSTTEPSLYPNQVLVEAPNSDVIVGNYLVHNSGGVSGPSRLTKINVVKGGQTTATYPVIPVGTTCLLVECQSEIEIRTEFAGTSAQIETVELYYPIDAWIDYFNIFTLDGFTLRSDYSIPNGTNDRQNEIMNDTIVGTNLYKALTDRDVINFRYVVDTFGNGIQSGSKWQLFNICKNRKNALAICNAPSAKDFKDSTDPKFTDITGALSTRLIADGGDLSLNPTVRYSLPSITQGASWGCFYFPYMLVRDLGKNITVVPAAYTSNNYIDKYATALPWSIVAGIRRGVVGGAGVVGIEINLDKEDREYLEPFGLNPIVFQSGAGPTIFANKTAQQTMKSALSSINVREVVIYIQDGIEAILKNYLFEFNTPQTRLEIKTLADNFLSTVQNDDGVYDYRNVMDETNNTPEVIDQNIGIIDTYIEPVRGMEILVQRTTILKTGAISTGNFQ